MAQGMTKVTRTDLASGISTGTDVDVDLGPSGKNLIPDGGAVIVWLRVYGINGSLFYVENPDTTDTVAARIAYEDWCHVPCSIPTSGGNKNKITLNVAASATTIEILGYVPTAAGVGQTDRVTIQPSTDDTWETLDVASAVDGTDTPGLMLLQIEDTTAGSAYFGLRHVDRTDAQWNDVWAQASNILHSGDGEELTAGFVVPKANGARWDIDCIQSSASDALKFHYVGYLHSTYYDQVETGAPRPGTELLLNDNGTFAAIDFGASGLGYISEATDGVFCVGAAALHRSGWCHEGGDDGDTYPGNSLCDMGAVTTTSKPAMYLWVPIDANDEADFVNEDVEVQFAPHGHAIDGATSAVEVPNIIPEQLALTPLTGIH